MNSFKYLYYKKNSKQSLLVILSALFLNTILSCSQNKQTSYSEEQPEVVEVTILEKQAIDRFIELNTTLLAYQEIFLSPASPGRIEKIHVDVGSKFSTGDLLVEMDQTQLLQAKLQLANLSKDLARFDTLLKADAISQQQYEQLKTQFEITKKNTEYLEKNLKLRAPFNGTVSAKFYNEGEMYSGAPAGLSTKAAILTLVQLNPLKAIINIPEQYYPLITIKTKVEIVPEIFPNETIKAKIFKIYPTIDILSHTFQVELQIPNAKEKLRPGMFCRAKIHLGKIETLMVPSTAVMKIPGSFQQYVFLAKNGQARQVLIRTGTRWKDLVEIFSDDIKVGDTLIIKGSQRLQDGTRIKIIQK